MQTHAFYIYLNSTLALPSWQRVVVGFDARDLTNYHNVELQSEETSRLHTLTGNTGRIGEWYYNFSTPVEDFSAEQRCAMWAQRQETVAANATSGSSLALACPCTRQQAQRDWSFWFGYYWGLSSYPGCATVLFSRSQSTIECCYDDAGALIVGPRLGGSFKLYNPLFFYQQNFFEDVRPYRDCCVDSNRCRTYYKYRPSDDCSAYSPPSFRECSIMLLGGCWGVGQTCGQAAK